jgi:Mg/Co/Ni transporter MgtE
MKPSDRAKLLSAMSPAERSKVLDAMTEEEREAGLEEMNYYHIWSHNPRFYSLGVFGRDGPR